MHSTCRAVPIVVVAVAAYAAATTAETCAAPAATTMETAAWIGETFSAFAMQAADRVGRWVTAGYALRPAVMIGLGAALLLPILMLVGLVLYRKQGRRTDSAPELMPPTDALGATVARLEIEGARTVLLPVGRDLLQIGRQQDNDICIDDETVQHYHAVIERTGEAGFVIVDVSGQEGQGLRVNGEPRSSAVLVDGDTLQLGRARMRFATAA